MLFLSNTGFDYLTLNRKHNTLSGEKSQQINLETLFVCCLVGFIIYYRQT